ncbi:thermonuclease family protein [Psychrobacillus sp. FJAT-51614]|uniref:Thermonuclease family protein n=1 Tax=Psychrobacillus mangrovi TaxID=3117745 RepID=A0ABU8F3W5_9BACI
MKKLLLLTLISFLFGCEEISSSGITKTSGTSEQIPVELIEVIDGDTIKVNYNGNVETIRYLLIDTPETNHKQLGTQPLSDEAKYRNNEILNSGELTIEFDVGNRLDDYGRMLAYIYIDGVSVQESLLEEGLARVAYVFPPNTRYLDDFEKASKIAEKQKVGVWETPNYVTSRGFNSSVFVNDKDSSKEAIGKCLIKGNINREGKKIYHVPSGNNYDVTKPEEWFCTEEEAIKAGFSKARE